METAEQKPPNGTGGDAAPVLVGWREKKETGMPTKGIVIFVGNAKSGKTSLAASFPGSYILELDKGDADHIAGRIQDINDVKEFRRFLPEVLEDPSIKTVVIDTVDTLGGWFEDEVARKFGLTEITERVKGVDGFEVWGEYNAKIEGLVNYLNECGKLVVINAHYKEPKTDANGHVIKAAGLNLRGKASDLLPARAKLIGYCYKKELGAGNAYYVTFKGGPLGTWGSRVDELNDKTLTLPKVNPYSAIAAVFDQPAKPAAEKAAPAKAKPETTKAAPKAAAAGGKK